MQQNENKNIVHIIKGSLAGSVLLAVAVAVAALVIFKMNLSDKTYIPLMILSVILSGYFSGYISTRKIRKNGLINGVLSVIPIVAILLGAMSVANNALNFFMIIPCVILIAFGAVGGIAAVNIKQKYKKK